MQYSNSLVMTAPQLDKVQSDFCYDIAIIGAGVSSAYTLIHYISLLEQQSLTSPDEAKQSQPVKILVTEKSGEFWTGVAYGSQSGCNSLLISTLKEFISQPIERQLFVDWLNKNRDWVFTTSADRNSELTRQWLQANEAAIAKGLWEDLFIPRYIFGLYIARRMTNLLQTATSKGLIEIQLVAADVLDIQPVPDGYQIDTANHTHFLTNKVVLAIGSPPNIIFDRPRSKEPNPNICYINNIYEPSLNVNIDRICRSLAHLDDRSQRQVIIIGSNAATLEILYGLKNSQVAASLIDKFIIISPNATFPHRISREVVKVTYSPQHLIDLLRSKSFTAKDILEAVQQDVAEATAQNVNIADIYHELSKLIILASDRLTFSEQQQFVASYAVELGKLQRRAGGEYLNVVDDLIAQNKLELVKGKFVKYSQLTTRSFNCEYIDTTDENPTLSNIEANVIINCAGFQDVTTSSSVLIHNLIQREICIPNDSHRGFIIDRNFEASKDFYVMGPLVAGNINDNFKVWHAESCQRIINFSQHLAAKLLN